MDKLKLHTPDFTQENIARLAELFPNCCTESRDENGVLRRAIDFDQLRQELSDHVVDGPRERYQLNWPGKRKALLAANAPIAKTLRPCRDESVDFDTTKNLFIEGDNLDALKLLQETYLNKVKMIYIDPPYNTGKDFIYSDDFVENADEFLLRSNQRDESDNRLVANPETNGRFHSDWLSMMYPRLRLARSLLRPDGVIFVSIDDNEACSLRLVLDEVFGSENFMCHICIVSNPRGRQSQTIASTHEYLLCYCRDHEQSVVQGQPLSEEQLKEFKHETPDGRKYRIRGLRHRGNASRRVDRPKMFYPFFVNPEIRAVSMERSSEYHVEVLPRKSSGEDGRWEWGPETARLRLELLEGVLVSGRNEWDIFQREFLDSKDGNNRTTKWKSVWDEKSINYQNGKAELKSLFDTVPFDFPKPTYLLSKIISGSTSDDDIVLDFFAGSGTTAHATFLVNASDSGRRRFVLVQLPEPTDRQSYRTIADITKDRVRRASVAARDEHPMFSGDLGFRVLKVDTSNMKDVHYKPDALSKDDVFDQIENIKEDRTPEDLLFQVLLDWGVDLSLPIAKETVDGKTVFFVDENALAACFDTGVTEEMVKALAARKPLRAVFRDAGFSSDSVKINVEQIFKLVSPSTEVKAI